MNEQKEEAATVIYMFFFLSSLKKPCLAIIVELNQFCLQSFSASKKHLYNNMV